MKQNKSQKQQQLLSAQHKYFLIEFGITLRKARKLRGWSQEKLGGKVNSSRFYISDVERGREPLCSEKISSLQKALGFIYIINITLCDNWVDDDSCE